MNILFIHPVFPGQFHQWMKALAHNGQHQIVHLSKQKAIAALHGVDVKTYTRPQQATQNAPPALRKFEDAVWDGQAVLHQLQQLKSQGFEPDIIYGYAGWGPTMFLKDFYPNVPFMAYAEWYLNAHGFEYGFDPDVLSLSTENAHCLRLQNAPLLMDLTVADAIITPTRWQHSSFPRLFDSRFHIIHDGVDTTFYQPRPNTPLVLPHIQLDLSNVPEIVTYTARGMEPYRGFPQVMAAIQLLLETRPQCHVVIAGSDEAFYSPKPSEGKSYQQQCLQQLGLLNHPRLHFTGWLSLQQYRTVLQASGAHIYFSYPYVLSWSMLEAMACGCLIIGSDTPPVREVITHQQNGLLTPFFEPDKLAHTVTSVLENPAEYAPLRHAARHTIEQTYSVEAVLPQHQAILTRVINNATEKGRVFAHQQTATL